MHYRIYSRHCSPDHRRSPLPLIHQRRHPCFPPVRKNFIWPPQIILMPKRSNKIEAVLGGSRGTLGPHRRIGHRPTVASLVLVLTNSNFSMGRFHVWTPKRFFCFFFFDFFDCFSLSEIFRSICFLIF
jgi:hypothetical protein